MTQLRDYQIDAIDRVRALMTSGKKRVALVLPTGTGKTKTAAEVVRRVVETGRKVLWFAHRAELVDQAARDLTSHGLIVGGVSASAQLPPNPYAPVQVATIQTLLSRGLRPAADLIVADEAHHYVADEFVTVLRNYPTALVVGLTATPERSDGRGLGEIFDGLVIGITAKRAIEAKHLVPCEVMRPPKLLDPGRIAQNPVDAYVEHAGERKAIVFARRIELAEEYAREFTMRGIPARCISAETPWAERGLYIDAFKRGTIRVLTNVFALTEGLDVPDVSCVILARGFSTPGPYIQAAGRALRLAPGKTDALILDLRGVSHDLGRPDDERVYSLDGRGIRLVDQNCYCPVCGAPRESGEPCAACGWKPESDEGGDSITGDKLEKYARKRGEDSEQRFKTLVKWMRVAKANNYKPGWVFMKWKVVYGCGLPSTDYYRALAAVNAESAA